MLEHSMLYPKTTLTRRRISMDGMWKFHLDERSVGENEGWIDGIPGEEIDVYKRQDIDLANCKIWLEVTEDSVAYAVEALSLIHI